MIEVENVTKRFGEKRALDDVSFAVEAGSVTGFLGPNGAGKSTTMRILTTFLPPDAGDAWVAGHSVTEEPRQVCQNLGYVPEAMPIHSEMRVREYLSYRARLKAVPRERRTRKIEEVTERCDLADVLGQRMQTLSRGFRQRVGIADALISDPSVLILDEPTSGLDPIQVQGVRALIAELRDRCTVLLSSHVLGEIEQVCSGIVIIVAGKIQLTSSRAEYRKILGRDHRLSVTVAEEDGTKSKCETALRSVEGVKRVEVQGDDPRLADTSLSEAVGGERRYLIEADRDVRRTIVNALSAARVPLLEIGREDPDLESLFVDVTRGVASGDPGGSGASQ